MLSSIVAFSVRRRWVVLMLAGALALHALMVAARAKLDVFPEFAPPLVIIHTEAPGLSPDEVELLVTRRVENAVNGVGSLESLRSQSIQGLSVVTAVFEPSTDVFRARQLVAERIADIAKDLPAGVQAPALAPLTSSTSVFLMVGLTSQIVPPMELRAIADFTVKPRLLAVPGVAKVVVFGGEVRALQVQLRPERLFQAGLSVNDVVEAARRATGVRGAGFVETPNQRLTLRTVGQAVTPELLRGTVLLPGAKVSLSLGDVADVADGPEPKAGDARVGDSAGVLLQISSQPGANTRDATGAAENALSELAPDLARRGIQLHPGLFRPASFIDAAIGNVMHSLLVGAVLVGAVLLLFLFNVRTAFISLTAIPLSLLAAVLVLVRFGFSVNTLTLGGLAIAIGEVVDDAIIDVENIFRRLRLAGPGALGTAAEAVILDASLEVRSGIVYATFVVGFVFLPVITMSGVQGKLFAPLGIAYVLAVAASLCVALTVTPALAAVLLPGRVGGAHEPPFMDFLRRRYTDLLDAVSGHPRLLITLVALLCIGALAALPFFGGAFLPEFRESQFIIHMSMVPGTSLAESMRMGSGVATALRAHPSIQSVCQAAGRAELADDTWGTHYSELTVALKPLEGEEAEAAQSEIRKILSSFPGAHFAVKPFLTERIEETIAGTTAQVSFKIFGDDLDALDRAAEAVAGVVSPLAGASDVQVESPGGVPSRTISLNREALRLHGVRPLDVLDAIQAAYQGESVGKIYEGNRVADVIVILAPELRTDPARLLTLPVRSGGGPLVPLGAVVRSDPAVGRYAILHEGARRRQAVTCNVRGRDVASFVTEALARIGSGVSLPPGTYIVAAGAAEAQAAAQHELLTSSLLAGAGILVLLALVFGSLRNLLLVLVNLPFALVGGVLAVFATGGWLSVGSLVGFVTLFGISTRNSIMLISHYEHLVHQEGQAWGLQTAIRGASERLAPVLMTAAVTGLGLLPIALGAGEAGREIEGPMAIVILGGLVTSTLLNLLVLPTLAVRYGSFPGLPEEASGLATSGPRG